MYKRKKWPYMGGHIWEAIYINITVCMKWRPWLCFLLASNKFPNKFMRSILAQCQGTMSKPVFPYKYSQHRIINNDYICFSFMFLYCWFILSTNVENIKCRLNLFLNNHFLNNNLIMKVWLVFVVDFVFIEYIYVTSFLYLYKIHKDIEIHFWNFFWWENA